MSTPPCGRTRRRQSYLALSLGRDGGGWRAPRFNITVGSLYDKSTVDTYNKMMSGK